MIDGSVHELTLITPDVLSSTNRKRINEFTENRPRMQQITYGEGDAKLLFLSEDSELSPQQVHVILDAQRHTSRTDISTGRCGKIAQNVVVDKVMDGALFTRNGAQDFVGFSNHVINYLIIPNNKIVGIDLTAGSTIDHRMGNFDVLAIEAENLEELLTKLHALYGGMWEEMPRDEISRQI